MKILTKSQIRTAEENAVSSGIFSFPVLMQNAGNKAAEEIGRKYDIRGKRILVVCGKGNNGGDGLIVAKNLVEQGADVSLYFPLGVPVSYPANCYTNIINTIKTVNSFSQDFDMIIDALFGIGFGGSMSDEISALIDRMNLSNSIKVAIDIPSGVNTNGEFIPNKAFKADFTVTFIALKPCFVLPTTSEYCGEVKFADIGVTPTDYAYLTIEKPTFKKREKNSHKGSYGTALFICGSYGMCGAEILSVKSALVSGLGIAKAVVCSKNYASFCVGVPEAVTIPVDTSLNGAPDLSDIELNEALDKTDAMLIGCGLGRSETAVKLVKRALIKTNVPVVIDADGINAVSQDINIIGKIKAPVILTPHPTEMARLCRTTTEEIEQNRISYAREFSKTHGCIVVLKGANTIVAAPDGRIYFNLTGNPGMATGGSGDVLSGVIVAYLAMGLNPLNAVSRAVYNHGLSGDMAAQKYSQKGMLPSDMIECLKFLSD